MPSLWTGKGNPYTRQEVRDRLEASLQRGEPIIAAGAGTGISAKFIERGGAASSSSTILGFRMSGHGSTSESAKKSSAPNPKPPPTLSKASPRHILKMV